MRAMRPPWKTLCLSAFVAAAATSLTACGGGGGGGGSVTQVPPGPTDPVDPPTPRYSAGPYAINGIDRIPQSMVKLTREEMQPKVVIAEFHESHAQQVAQVACESYIQSGDCDSQAGKFRNSDGTVRTEAGTSPFTKVVSYHNSLDAKPWLVNEITRMPGVKIVNYSNAGNDPFVNTGSGSFSFLVIHSAGNYLGNMSWYDEAVNAAKKNQG